MTSLGHDEPVAMRQRGFQLNYFFSKADAFVGIAPQFEGLYRESSLPESRLKKIPNGVDTNRFRPVTNLEKVMLRDQLELPKKMKLILFVGHFSKEKSPDILFEALEQYVAEKFPDTGIIFVGSTNPDHYEVDAKLVKNIQEIVAPFINEQIFFIERTHEIEKYYQTADIFVLPSSREGMPNALLEAMACGLPVIVSRLEGVTDWVITDSLNGLLVEPGVQNDLGEAIKRILGDGILAETISRESRETIEGRFSINTIAEKYLELYRGFTPLV